MSAPVGIVMLNMGGPASQAAVAPFLDGLFADRDLMQLPAHGLLGPLIARMRAPAVRRAYARIGGGSPILDHSRAQAAGLAARLGRAARVELAFRYAPPRIERALDALLEAGVEHAIAFPQYPQFSHATTGSSLRDLARAAEALGPSARRLRWTVIERWFDHPRYVEAVADALVTGLQRFSADEHDEGVTIVFSAHSLPLRAVEAGDPYPHEIAATVHAVAHALGLDPRRFVLAWQSAVGPLRWLGPGTETVLERLGHAGTRNVLVVPVGFTCDHIETLYELDQLAADTARACGIRHFERAPSLNDAPAFLDALAAVVRDHLAAHPSLPDHRLHGVSPGA